MTPRRTDETWTHKVTLAVIAGVVSGAVRAGLTWLLDRLTSP
ncbi:MAG TPA: hypothetical protein VFB74_20985 [Kribbellaceae bacterium]|nr:hypothetical protein [Kribbellaceae bacterium]